MRRMPEGIEAAIRPAGSMRALLDRLSAEAGNSAALALLFAAARADAGRPTSPWGGYRMGSGSS